jgi:pyridoxamine 5'-phosphate oxidase
MDNFSKSDVDPDPIRQFHLWFDQAVKANELDPDAMALSTASPEGRVSSRIVLLKGCSERGFVFYTNYESRKSGELGENPWAALTFYWRVLHRQARIEGRVEKVSPEESAEYFATRPRGSQLGAWASPQSREISDRLELEKSVEELERRFDDGPIPCPPNWGGFLLRPMSIEFWQGRENRLHDRVLYTLQADGDWRISQLAP